MRPVRRRLPIAVAAALLVLTAAACSTTGATGPASGAVGSGGTAAGAPTVSGAWVRAAPAGGQTAGYLTITGGTAADALVSASSPGASMVELHETSMDSGMVGMHAVESLAIPAGGSVALAPGGYHLMIMGLGQALSAGGAFQIDLVFQHAGKVTVQAEVRAG